MRTLLLATNNSGKLREIQAILKNVYPRVLTLKEAGLELDVEEDGNTFEANALKKAREAARISGMDALADDSGLCVDALGGRPGVYSARYAGEHATDEENNQKLLLELRDVPAGQRGAAYACCIALCRAEGSSLVAHGRCAGRILRGYRGENGFGYDPLFWYEPFRCTFAEVRPEQKNEVSHRAVALRALAQMLKEEGQK